MLPPRLIRRLVLVPLVIVMAGALVGLTPAVALLAAAFSLAGRSRPGLNRALRLLSLTLVWFLGETAALAVLLCLWIASGFGGRMDTEPYQSRHYGVMRWFLDMAYHAAQWSCGLKVEVEGPADEPGPVTRPVIVFSRHAGPGDSLLLVHYLLTACGRRPRVVMKAALQLDPSLDIVANRLPNAFIKHREASTWYYTEQIKRLAVGLDHRSALVIFPEGGNWTPLRWRRAVARLRRMGEHDLAERAVAMPNVLPPRPGGALAAIGACPSADVIFVAHAGLDSLVSVGDVWRSLSANRTVRARWWLVPASQVPREASQEAQVSWLYDWWERIDSWISQQHEQHADAIATTPGSAPSPG
jgi:1-acyl-sn-glycerol-3-phosphate acyltransferase